VYAFFVAVAAALIIGGVPTLVALIGSDDKGKTGVAGGIATALFTVANWLFFYFNQTVVGFTWDSVYSSFWLWGIELLVVTILLWLGSSRNGASTGTWVVTIVTALALVLGLVANMDGVFNQSRADVLKSALKVQVHENTNDLPDTDVAHILTVPQQLVNLKVKSALRGDASTRFAVDGGDHMSLVDGHMYWLTGIYPDDLTDYNKVGGNARGFIATDTEDYNANSQYKWDPALGEGDANPNTMKVHENGWFQHSVNRVIWNKYRGQIVSNLHLEVDDQWKPWYVASLNKRPLGFNMGDSYPNKVLVIDPATGNDVVYDIANAPAWIDQVWGQSETKSALNNWGQWSQANYGFFYEGPANRYQVNDEPQLVATKTGLAWQVLMTSQKKDTVASYYVLVNARTGETHAYKVPELQLEGKVIETVRESPANRNRLEPTHAALYKISGVLTWVMPMLKKEAGTGADDESNFNGLSLIPASNVNGTAVTLKETGDVRGDAFRDYERFLATSQTTGAPQGSVNDVTTTGKVDDVSSPVAEGNVSAFYFTLAEKPGVEFRVESNSKMPEVKYIKEGHVLHITYRDSGQQPYTVIGYDDESVALVTTK
jgi:hypothetical protein